MAIPTLTQTNHHVGNVEEDIPMGIRAEDFSHVAFMFENLYSRPIEAIIREYSTNAWDSHVFAGNIAPIEISLPSEGNLEFSVQDYGVGMTIDTLRNVYAMYGASDKRNTNSVAGQLGMGSKSGLSYATAFTIVAVRDNVRVVAMSTKDEHGRGVLKVLEKPSYTSEPNGVRISVPVERQDVRAFRDYAANLFQFWEPGTVLLDGEAPKVPEWRSTALQIDADTWLVNSDADLYGSYVIMGNVPYPVPNATVNRQSVQFVARLNIGDVDFAPSREDVRHTPHTDETLADLQTYIAENRQRAIDTALAETSTRWEDTVLKTLWMNRNNHIASSASSPIWAYNPSAYGNKARSMFSYRVAQLAMPRLVVITDFPAKNVSTVARDRLDDFARDNNLTNPSYVIFPQSASTGMLDGRPLTFSWETVLGATKAAPAAAKVKREKAETRYTTLGGPDMTAAEIAKDTRVLYLQRHASARMGTMGHTVVRLYSCNQEARLLRLVPQARPYGDEVAKRRKAAEKAVTLADRQIVTAQTLPSLYQNLDASKIADPELAAAITMSKTAKTQSMIDAESHGITISATENLATKFAKRYPLLHADRYGYSSYNTPALKADAILYINAKHEAEA